MVLREIGKQEWDELIRQVSRINLMQTWEYGDAQATSRHLKARRFLLVDEQGKRIALLQALTFTLPLIGGLARINRGPLFFDTTEWGSNVPPPLMRAAAVAVKDAARRWGWRMLRFSPEFSDSADARGALESAGFRKRSDPAWGSIVLDLKKSQADLLRDMSHAWRKNLKAAERSGLELHDDGSPQSLDHLLEHYSDLQQQKGFQGISRKLLDELWKQRGPRWDLRVLSALKDGKKIGGILFIGHGDTCTALVNWSDTASRSLRPNNFIYWKALLLYQSLGYSWFDMGGLNSATPEGIARFKRETGGQAYQLVGEWH